jgi:cation diffusion facilitator CzcD-associated flavoprotein CzcO
MTPVKRIAVIGAGPAGAIAVDCLAQEKAFDVIRVFERREKAGGCWYVCSLCNSLPSDYIRGAQYPGLAGTINSLNFIFSRLHWQLHLTPHTDSAAGELQHLTLSVLFCSFLFFVVAELTFRP